MDRVIIMILAIAAALMALCHGNAAYIDEAEARKTAAHQMAEAARTLGYDEDSAIILAAREHYRAAQADIDADVDLLARVVYFEAGSSWLSDRHQQLVAAVVINRCADPRFPDTIAENVYKKGQYACASKLYSVSGDSIPARCFDNARAAAYGEVECPEGVIFQAQFRQGRGVYEHIGNTFFCWG